MDMTPAGLLRLLGDDTRLRLLRVLSQEALNVSELTGILGVAQSGVSRHLGLLREAGLVTEQRAGAFTLYRLADGDPHHTALWQYLGDAFAHPSPAARADDARLAEVRRLRKESFRQHGGGEERGQLVPGRSWAAWARALGLLLPPIDVADIGCGEGHLAIEMARWARRVIAVDQHPDVLQRARAMARRQGLRSIVWKRGEIERVPIADHSVDLVLLSQALHHAERPGRALAEAARILRPGGRVLVLDLREHGEAWVRETLGDKWQGFSDAQLRDLLDQAGFTDITVRTGVRRAGDPFAVVLARATVQHDGLGRSTGANARATTNMGSAPNTGTATNIRAASRTRTSTKKRTS